MTKLCDTINSLKHNSLTSLEFGYDEISGIEAVAIAEALEVNSSLINLELEGNEIGDTGTVAIAKVLKVNSSLINLELGGNEIGEIGATAIAEALKMNSSLVNLDLGSNEIGEIGAIAIAEALKVNSSLVNLDLGSNEIGEIGAITIAEALKVNSSLVNLDLGSNKIGEIGAIAIAVALKINILLTRLELGGNEIGEIGAITIAEALKVNNTLINLGLRYNNISDAGVTSIVQALNVNHSLTSLEIGSNEIGEIGAIAIAEVLKVNSSLVNLDLGSNEIGEIGATAIAEALKVNSSLVNLDLGSNEIGEIGAIAIAEALILSKSILNLNLWGNKIGESGAIAIAEALKVNNSLITLELGGNEIGESGAIAIAEALKVNNSLITLELGGNGISTTLLKTITQYISQKVCDEELKAMQVKEPVALEYKVHGSVDRSTNIIREEELNTITLIGNLQTLINVNELVDEGNNKTHKIVEKGILIFGKAGIGKSTLVASITGKMLQNAINPIDDIVVNHSKITKTNIPNECNVNNTIIWDFPGFQDNQDIEQEIVNSFYIKKIFKTTKAIKFVLVVAESSLVRDKGKDFLDTINKVIGIFTNIFIMDESLSLVITQCPSYISVVNIIKSINHIIDQNQSITSDALEIIRSLQNSIHIVHRANIEGLYEIRYDFLLEIDKRTKYTNEFVGQMNVIVSDLSKSYIHNMLENALRYFYKITEAILQVVANTHGFIDNEFDQLLHSYTMVKSMTPKSIIYQPLDRLPEHKSNEYFINLEVLFKLYVIISDTTSHCNNFVILNGILQIFEEYVIGDQKKIKIQEYNYVLNQQVEYIAIFNQLYEEQENHDYLNTLNDNIEVCKMAVSRNLEQAVKSIIINPMYPNIQYYQVALKYLVLYNELGEKYSWSIEMQSKIYEQLGNIYANNQDIPNAVNSYIQALCLNKSLFAVYNKIGDLFFEQEDYKTAIDFYKVVNNVFKIKVAFKKQIKSDVLDLELMMSTADYFVSIGLYEKAKNLYHDIFSLSQDDQLKTDAWSKISDILTISGDLEKAVELSYRATNREFYNFDLVDLKQMECLLMAGLIKDVDIATRKESVECVDEVITLLQDDNKTKQLEFGDDLNLYTNDIIGDILPQFEI